MTKGKAQISKSELPQLIKNIEANGGDASALKAILGDEHKTPTPEEVTDDELVKYNRSLSVVKEGERLICMICHKPSTRLTSDACDDCFRLWSLDCKTAILKRRSKDGSTNNG
jgi:hypothetical protein